MAAPTESRQIGKSGLILLRKTPGAFARARFMLPGGWDGAESCIAFGRVKVALVCARFLCSFHIVGP